MTCSGGTLLSLKISLSDRRINLPSGREFRMLLFKAEDYDYHSSTPVQSISPQFPS